MGSDVGLLQGLRLSAHQGFQGVKSICAFGVSLHGLGFRALGLRVLDVLGLWGSKWVSSTQAAVSCFGVLNFTVITPDDGHL